jgi:hypothetical protein
VPSPRRGSNNRVNLARRPLPARGETAAGRGVFPLSPRPVSLDRTFLVNLLTGGRLTRGWSSLRGPPGPLPPPGVQQTQQPGLVLVALVLQPVNRDLAIHRVAEIEPGLCRLSNEQLDDGLDQLPVLLGIVFLAIGVPHG